MYCGAHRNKRSNSRKLGETTPLELSKLGSVLGSFERVLGSTIAARIDSFKVCRRTKNPRAFKAGECQISRKRYTPAAITNRTLTTKNEKARPDLLRRKAHLEQRPRYRIQPHRPRNSRPHFTRTGCICSASGTSQNWLS